MEIYDVAVAGAGPAGLNAALVLARSMRKVVVIDSGNPRNLKAAGLHGYLTRDGISPSDFLKLGRKEILYYGVEFIEDFVNDIIKDGEDFVLSIESGDKIKARKVLLATGIKDNLPPLPGIDKMYGKSVFHCPYCDGWESRGKNIAVYANGKAAYALGLSLKTWSENVFIISDGPHRIGRESISVLELAGIKIFTSGIKCLHGTDGILRQIELEKGEMVDADVLYFSAPQYQKSVLAERLGCRISSKGFVVFGKNQSTNIRGLYVAGDAAHDMKFVIVAAAEGAKAAIAINIELQEEEVQKLKQQLSR